MLPESRLERSHLRLTFNRSISEPSGANVAATRPDELNLMPTMERQQKRLYLQLQHHHNQVHLHHISHKTSSASAAAVVAAAVAAVAVETPEDAPTGVPAVALPSPIGMPLSWVFLHYFLLLFSSIVTPFLSLLLDFLFSYKRIVLIMFLWSVSDAPICLIDP